MKIEILNLGEKIHNAKESFHAASMSIDDFEFFKSPTQKSVCTHSSVNGILSHFNYIWKKEAGNY
jgi:hypothetical protein